MTQPSPERWARIEEALDAALDRVNEDRATLLDELCGDDADLRREVSRLLASIDRSGSSFERPPVEVVEAATISAGREQLEPGKIVGAYRVIELLGRGGMGAVYLAERADGAFDRQVALKIVKRGMDSEEILRRFRRERQILARLEHPNIAGLLDGGITDDGVPYFVMELARGEAIDRWCDAHRLTIEQRIRLFIPVCDAVRHAHRSLIVHRDLKPSNILVVAGQPKLLDFGIAKVLSAEELDESQATRVQERRLTPEYAAPEQVRGEPTTTATDVYALGVILYELLTGRPPYHVQGGMAEVERVVCTVEPRAPSTIATRDAVQGSAQDARTLAAHRSTRPEVLRTVLHGDLDAIVLKALAKEPERRYPSVNALIDDLRRYMEGHPVEARPASRWYHIGKFVARNRTAVGLATAAVLALIVGSGVALWQAGIAQLESRQRQAEAERAAAARDFLVQTYGEFDPDRLGGQRTFSHDELIDKSLANLAAYEDQPELYAVVANTVGQLFFKLGDAHRADSLFRRSLEILEPLGEHPDLAVSLMGVGEVARRELRFEDAVRCFQRALDIRRATLPAHDPRIPEAIGALATALYNGDQNEPARQLYNEVLSFGDATPVETRAAALEGLADLWIEQARNATPESARTFYANARDRYSASINSRLENRSEPGPDVARAMWGLAEAMDTLGEREEALTAYRRSLGILEKVYGEKHRDVAFGQFLLGIALTRRGQHTEAAEYLETAVAQLESTFGPSFPYTIGAKAALGRVLVQLGRYGESVDHLETAVIAYRNAGSESLVGTFGLDRADAEKGLARAYQEMGRTAAALELLRSSYEYWLSAGGESTARDFAAELARLFERVGRADSAAVYHTRAGISSRGGT